MNKDLTYSFFYGILARSATLLYQVVSVPLVIALLGNEGFNKLNVLTAGVSWMFSLGGALLPTVVGDISRATINKEKNRINSCIFTAMALLVGFALIATLLMAPILIKASKEYVLVYLLSLFTFVFSIAENYRIAVQENYKNNIFIFFSNLIPVLIIFAMYSEKYNPSIIEMIFLNIGCVLFFKSVNFLFVIKKIRFSTEYFDRSYSLKVIKQSYYFILLSLSFYLNTGGVLTVINKLSGEYISAFVVLQKLSLTLMGVVVMLRNPLWAKIAGDMHLGKGKEIAGQYSKILRWYLYCTPIIILVGIYLVPGTIYYWSGKTIIIESWVSFTFALYVTLQVIAYINSIVYYGCELFKEVSIVLLAESLLNIMMLTILTKFNGGLEYVFALMSLTTAISGLIINRIIMRRIIK